MAGLVNDNIVFPVLDLIKDAIRDHLIKYHMEEGDPFQGTPSVELFREHPLDDEKVTGATLTYESEYALDIVLEYGSDDESTYPEGVDSSHDDYEYYRYWRLTSVTTALISPAGEELVSYNIGLNYDKRGLLTGTTVARIR